MAALEVPLRAAGSRGDGAQPAPSGALPGPAAPYWHTWGIRSGTHRVIHVEMQEPNTSTPAYVAQVERAQAGELDAFGELVASFQDLVVGTAFGWLRDIELAREVAQETFANAHAALDQLDEPAAFPGWLRRIVRKHCDRVTRRGRLEVVPLEPDHAPARQPRPDDALAERHESERLRLAVEALPDAERLPLVLHYFAGEPQPALAEFLELPLPTLKKRLRSARARLRTMSTLHPEDEPMTEPTPLRPSRDPHFGDTVRFYLALRGGDASEVARMLERSPQLIEAEQRWDPSLVYEGVLPFASQATPLVTAVERDDPAMVSLLLAKGASPDGPCGCVTGEAPLWAAVLLQNLPIARLLLEAGADPDRLAATGNAPLHLAAMRDQPELVALLLRHEANAGLEDRAGRTPRDWALLKGHEEAAALLPPDPREASTPASIPAAGSTLHESGVKALDLFAPLFPGSLVRVPFRAGVGMLVLLHELSHRWATDPRGAAVWTGFAQGPFDPDDLRGELREAGIGDLVEVHVAARDEPAQTRRRVFTAGLERALSLREEGRDVLLVLLTETGFEIDTEASFKRLFEANTSGAPGAARITSFVISAFEDREEDGRAALRAPWDARITLDRKRARRGLYPSIDPTGSLSRSDPGERHRRLASAARTLLADYERLDPDLALPDPASLAAVDRDLAQRAQRLLRYLTQPFVTTEPFTGRPASRVGLAALLDDVAAILAGEDVASEVELTPNGLSRPGTGSVE